MCAGSSHRGLGCVSGERQSPLKANEGKGETTERDTTYTQTDMGECVQWACEGRQTEEAEEDRWGRQVRQRGWKGIDRQTGRGRGRQTGGWGIMRETASHPNLWTQTDRQTEEME